MTETTQGVFGGLTEVSTSDGRAIRVDPTYPALRVSDGINTVVLPHPESGYAGREFVMSADETHLIVWVYSGQNEVGYELFELNPLRHVTSVPYVHGVGNVPVISGDGRTVAMAWAGNPGLFAGEVDTDDDDLLIDVCEAHWCTVQVLEIDTGLLTECDVHVQLGAGSSVESDTDHYPEDLAFVDGGLHVRGDWGVVAKVPLPLPNIVLIDGPNASI